MAELTFTSPITRTYDRAEDAALTLADDTDQAKFVVRAADGTAARKALAVPFGQSRADGDVLVAGSRPDEWMLLGPHAAVASMVADLPTTGHVSVVDWTHGRAAFRLSGEVATSALEKICGIDWSDNMTPNGAVTSASVAVVTCDLIRNDIADTPSYLILCDRSFGQYLFDAIIDASDEFGVDVITT